MRRTRLATFAITVIVMAVVQSSAHRAAVRHVVCSEHGELVEAPLAALATSSDDLQLAAIAGDSHGDDEHCVAATGLRPFANPSSIIIVTMAEPPRIDFTLKPAPQRATTDLLHSAPKTSPPNLRG